MPDLVLKDGREIEIDLYRLSIGEWRALLKPEQSDEEEYKTLAKICGLEAKDIENLPYPEFRLLVQAITQKAANPVSDPN
jgi:hypothetical protein